MIKRTITRIGKTQHSSCRYFVVWLQLEVSALRAKCLFAGGDQCYGDSLEPVPQTVSDPAFDFLRFYST